MADAISCTCTFPKTSQNVSHGKYVFEVWQGATRQPLENKVTLKTFCCS